MSVLLIEDSDEYAGLIASSLERSEGEPVRLVRTRNLAEGLAAFGTEAFTAVLLDPGLPDASGVESVARLHEEHPEVPIVVITASPDPVLADRMIDAGAAGHFVKTDVRPRAVRDMIRIATLERDAASTSESDSEAERHRRLLERVAGSGRTSISREIFGAGALRHVAPEVFSELVGRYGAILDRTVHDAAFRRAHELANELHSLAQDLGWLRAGPRDVIEIHLASLEQKMQTGDPARARGYETEGHWLVLELMGDLVSCYRRHRSGPRPSLDTPGRRKPRRREERR